MYTSLKKTDTRQVSPFEKNFAANCARRKCRRTRKENITEERVSSGLFEGSWQENLVTLSIIYNF